MQRSSHWTNPSEDDHTARVKHAWCFAGSLLTVTACSEPREFEDYGAICISSTESSSGHRLWILADSKDCSADHDGAEFRCEVIQDPQNAAHVRVHTYFQEGEDPDDACAGPRTTSCTLPVQASSIQVTFGDLSTMLELPLASPSCFPETFVPTNG